MTNLSVLPDETLIKLHEKMEKRKDILLKELCMTQKLMIRIHCERIRRSIDK